MPRKYVAVEFKAGGRTYTYHNDDEPVACGDLVRVEVRHGEQRATVVSTDSEEPPFATKPILGLIERTPEQSMENEHGK